MESKLIKVQGTVSPEVSLLAFSRMPVQDFIACGRCLGPFVRTTQDSWKELRRNFNVLRAEDGKVRLTTPQALRGCPPTLTSPSHAAPRGTEQGRERLNHAGRRDQSRARHHGVLRGVDRLLPQVQVCDIGPHRGQQSAGPQPRGREGSPHSKIVRCLDAGLACMCIHVDAALHARQT